MDKKILKEFFEQTKLDPVNTYSEDLNVELMSVAKEELKNLKIPFKLDKKNNKVLTLFPNSYNPKKYVKGFYPNNTRLGKNICQDKFLTQKFLELSNVKTPIGKKFTQDQFPEALRFITENVSNNYVLKPTSMSMSLGTYLNVNESNFTDAWNGSFDIQNKYKVASPAVLIQEQIQGLEIRIVIIDGKVGTAIFRGPGHVKGDGHHTIRELIEIKNEEREKHNYLNLNRLIINDNLINSLKDHGLTLETILPKDDYYILYTHSSVNIGREVFEISKHIHPNIFEQALKAVTSIPGAHTAGVDIFISDLDAEEGTVIEVNLNPALQLHYFPMTGEKTQPLNDIFKSYNVERNLLSDELSYDNLTKEEFDIIKSRFKYLYNKEKSLSSSYKYFLDM